MIRRPTPETLVGLATRAARETPTYSATGATLSDDSLPAGYEHDDRAVRLGSTPDTFDSARTALQRWAAHRGAGLVLSEGATVEEGATVALAAPLPLVAFVTATCRIVRVVDETDRYGFAYGTLPHHPEEGEEAFLVERTDADVRFRIIAFSRPNLWAARLARPLARRLQLRALDAYLGAMQRAVA